MSSIAKRPMGNIDVQFWRNRSPGDRCRFCDGIVRFGLVFDFIFDLSLRG